MEKCNIDEISKFLVKQGMNKKYPDITKEKKSMKKEKLNIAVIGLGNIGSYLIKYLQSNKSILSKKNNCEPNIIYVSAKNRNKKRNFKIRKNQWLNNYLDSTKSNKVDIIIELIGGSEGPAKKISV